MLCHHRGTRAAVLTTMRDTGGMLKIFKLVYSVVRRARSLSLTKKNLKKNHKETPIDERGRSLPRVFIYRFFMTRGKGVLHCVRGHVT